MADRQDIDPGKGIQDIDPDKGIPDTDPDKGVPDTDPEERIRIIVDGTPHVVLGEEITFDAVVHLAYPDGGRGALITYTVTFYNGGGHPSEGALNEGEKVIVKDGTVFNVTRTDRS